MGRCCILHEKICTDGMTLTNVAIHDEAKLHLKARISDGQISIGLMRCFCYDDKYDIQQRNRN